MMDKRTAGDLDLGRMLHDLKAPVRSMRAFAEALGEDYAEKLDAEGREYLGFIISGADDLRAKIEGISAYCKLDDQPVQIAPVDAVSVVAEAIAIAPATLSEDLEDQSSIVETDSARLRIALDAVIGNAVKFITPDSRPEVMVSVRVAGGSVVIAISDKGIGVAEKDWERAFEPFICLNPADEFSGAGMGLPIARRAMRQIGGDVRFVDAGGNGAAVEIVVGTAA
jgi:signal transduction histidine kinase